MDLGVFPIPDEKQMSPSLPPSIYFSLSHSMLTSLTLSIVNLCWRQSTSLFLSVSGCPLPFLFCSPLHISLQVPLSLHLSASLAISVYLSLSGPLLKPVPQPPHSLGHTEGTQASWEDPKSTETLSHDQSACLSNERHAGLMVRWNCKLYGLPPTAPVLSHGATKKQGNSVKWSVFGNSQLTILWQTLGKKKKYFCV